MVTRQDVYNYTADYYKCKEYLLHKHTWNVPIFIDRLHNYFKLTDAEINLIMCLYCTPSLLDTNQLELFSKLNDELDKRNLYQIFSLVCYDYDYINDEMYTGWNVIKEYIERGVIPKYDKIH